MDIYINMDYIRMEFSYFEGKNNARFDKQIILSYH